MKIHICLKPVILTLFIGGFYLTASPGYEFSTPTIDKRYDDRTGEFLLDSTIVYVSDSGTQAYPKIAFDGINYMMIWWVSDYQRWGWDLYAARINQAGEMLDPAGILLFHRMDGSEWYYECPANIAFNGTNYLVVYTYGYGNGQIYGQRIATDGTVLDPPMGITISESLGSAPTVASDGSNCLVVWQTTRDFNIKGARVSADGVVLDTSGIVICGAPGWQSDPSVCFAGTQYFVAWTDRRNVSDIYGARVGVDGTVLDSSGIRITMDTVGWSPGIASDGANCLAVWTSFGIPPDSYAVYGARINAAGAVLDTNAITISYSSGLFRNPHPIVAFDTANYFVVWNELAYNGSLFKIAGVRVSASGTVLDTADIIMRYGFSPYNPVLVFNGNEYLFGWRQRGGSHYDQSWTMDDGDIYYTRMTTAGRLIDTAGLALSDEANRQRMPRAAFDGTNFLACWMEYHRDDYNDIYATRLSGAGIVLDTVSFPLSTGIDWRWYGKWYPDVAFGGSYYLASWCDYDYNIQSDRELTRITSDGLVVDTDGYFLYDAGIDPRGAATAFDGQNFLLVLEDGNSIFGNRVSTEGQHIDSMPFFISGAIGYDIDPDLSFDGTNYLAVWKDWRNGNNDIYGALVTPQGSVLNPNGIPICTAGSNQAHCAIEFGGANYLAVWDDDRNGSGRDIYASRVNIQGQALDSSGICIAGGATDQSIPDVSYDGVNYLVIWRDSSAADPGDIYCARVSPNGSVMGIYPVTTMPGLQTEPSLTRGNDGRILMLWSGYLDSLDHKPVKARRAWGKMYPFTQIAETANGPIPSQGLRLEIAPNPVVGKVVMYAAAGRGASVKSIKIYDNLGRCVRSFALSGRFNAVIWDGRDNDGRMLPLGVYFCRLDDGLESTIKKIIKLK